MLAVMIATIVMIVMIVMTALVAMTAMIAIVAMVARYMHTYALDLTPHPPLASPALGFLALVSALVSLDSRVSLDSLASLAQGSLQY